MGKRPERQLPLAGAETRATLESLLGGGDYTDTQLRRSFLAGLTADTQRVRTSSAWALCLLADDCPETVPAIVDGLLARLSGEHGVDASQTLAHIDRQYPERVRSVLSEAGHDPTAVLPAQPSRHPIEEFGLDAPDRIADIRELVDTTGRYSVGDTSGATDGGRSRQRDDDRVDPTGGHDSPGSSAASDSVHDADTVRAGRRTEAPRRVKKRREIDEIEGSDTFRAIREQCQFEDIAVVKPRDGGRYADTVRARAIDDTDERGVALGLLDRPESDRESYADAMADSLARWHAASNHDGVLAVRDWGRVPRPWLAKDPIEETLAEWRPDDTAARLECAHEIARAVAVCHRQGVIHAGLDPGNVVLPAGTIEPGPRPVLDNVGCMLVFRQYFDPTDYLDPRYAAPEYFDDSYGGIDQSTDIYQLGAVLYHCFTGRAPFRGTYSEIRQGILESDPSPPTELNASLPAPVDDVVEKALAKQKLVRYETASQLQRDIQHICDRCGL